MVPGLKPGLISEGLRGPEGPRFHGDADMGNVGTDGKFTGFCELELGIHPVCPRVFGAFRDGASPNRRRGVPSRHAA